MVHINWLLLMKYLMYYASIIMYVAKSIKRYDSKLDLDYMETSNDG